MKEIIGFLQQPGVWEIGIVIATVVAANFCPPAVPILGAIKKNKAIIGEVIQYLDDDDKPNKEIVDKLGEIGTGEAWKIAEKHLKL